MLSVIKRDGKTQDFDASKIVKAVESAFKDVYNGKLEHQHTYTAEYIARMISEIKETKSVEEIQNIVEEYLMKTNYPDVARAYIRYRYKREISRRENTTDKTLMELLRGESEYWNDENANKNARVVHTQRDYMAGIASTDITRRLLLPKDVVEAHDEGIIHFHDADYFAQNVLYNCCLINLEDMLQNGTMINGVKIERPHTLRTASTIATQLITAVSSSQYGGTTISLAHLAPFVNESRERYRERFSKLVTDNEELLNKLVEESTQKEIVDAVQTFNYQVNSMTTTNGQAPFLSVSMYLGEVEDGLIKNDLAKLIEEFLNQRILGFKNEKGVYVTPAFPKLLYFLEEDNIRPDSKYWYLTQLAAQCTAKRMVPDYISVKVMKELKNGNVYPCMGAVDGSSIINYKFNKNGEPIETSFEQFWLTMCNKFKVQNQPNRAFDLYIDVEHENLFIKDTCYGWVRVKKLTRIVNNEWVEFTFCSHYEDMDDVYINVKTTIDHPFPVFDVNSKLESPNGNYGTTSYRRTEAKDIKITDYLYSNTGRITITNIKHYYSADESFAYDVETESDTFEVNGVWSNNCRSFLTPDRTTKNYSKSLNYDKQKASNLGGVYYGRYNQGVVTINLPDIALSAKKEYEELHDESNEKWLSSNESLDDIFWRIFDERLELCHKALRIRHDRLCNGVSDMAPILWQHGAIARLDKGESIRELLYHGYSTISLGYIGLYECVKVITGESQSQPNGKQFGLQVMKFMNEHTAKWKQAEDIDYSVYGTPSESLCYKTALSLKRRFGSDVFVRIDGHDRNYLTNSYHVSVFEQIDAFTKLQLESEFQALSPGGAISYIECADLTKNIEAVLQVIQFIYETIMYAELNTKSDYCQKCGYDGEIQIIDKDNKLVWHCPNCGNEDKRTLNVARRTCGYIGINFWNGGKTNEIRDRYVHLDNHEA